MQDYYYELVVKVSSHHELFSDFLVDTLPIGFEESDDGFIIRSEDELETIAWGIEQFAQALQKALGKPVEVECEQKKLKNSDWVALYQKSITPIQIDKFYIHPTWDEPKNDLINIAINPSLAFGTGHHPTTSTSLKAIAKYVKNGDDVLDVGCGSAILAIASAKLGASVDACDTDEVCIQNSIENAMINKIDFNSIWQGSVEKSTKSYDVVIANIVADVLTFIANDLKKVTKDNGILILSGIMDKYEKKVLNFYMDCEILDKIQTEEWITLILKKRV